MEEENFILYTVSPSKNTRENRSLVQATHMTRNDTVFFSVIYHLLYDGKPSFPKEIWGREKMPWNKFIFSTGEELSASNPSLFPVFLMDFGLPATDSNGHAQEWPCCVIIA